MRTRTLQLCIIWTLLVVLQTLIGCSFSQNTAVRGPGITVIADSPAPVLGIVLDQNMRIVSVESSSAAEQGGIQAGDSLKSINSKPVSNPQQAREIFYSSNPTIKLQIQVLRDNQQLQFDILLHVPMSVKAKSTATPVPSEMIYF